MKQKHESGRHGFQKLSMPPDTKLGVKPKTNAMKKMGLTGKAKAALPKTMFGKKAK